MHVFAPSGRRRCHRRWRWRSQYDWRDGYHGAHVWESALVRAALESKFLSTRYLRLSLSEVTRGGSAVVSKLLSRIGLCSSDKSRWKAEEKVVKSRRDHDVIPRAENLESTSTAWDKCDTDATSTYESTISNGIITGTVHAHPSKKTTIWGGRTQLRASRLRFPESAKCPLPSRTRVIRRGTGGHHRRAGLTCDPGAAQGNQGLHQ